MSHVRHRAAPSYVGVCWVGPDPGRVERLDFLEFLCVRGSSQPSSEAIRSAQA
jgi:hypothetical protein